MANHQRLSEIKEKFSNESIRQATLCFLIEGDRILLAMKKRGFAVGKWNGAGGKKNNDETIGEAAKREAFEEIGIKINKLDKVATLNFYFSEKPEWNQQVIVYLTDDWVGEPKESEEMAPKWFDIKEIPYEQMWEDDQFWLPKVLNDVIIEADFLFDNNQKMIEKDIKEITSH